MPDFACELLEPDLVLLIVQPCPINPPPSLPVAEMPPVPVVCALLWDAATQRVLLARRPPGKHLAGLWEFPGGKIDPGETAAEALYRELQEELGCQVEILAALDPVPHSYPWVDILMTPFVCRVLPDSPPPRSLEHSELAWAAWPEVGQFDLAPADLPLLVLNPPFPQP